ncbi:hypothetical protein DsansV1_C46g0241491 [Dioscorea sansibarensis]
MLVFSCPESNGDCLSLEVQDNNKMNLGQANINISALADSEGGLVVETLIYDLVLEAALRALHFNTKNLHICGIWEWLLHEFADYYGVSDAYTKLRYLKHHPK